MQLHTKYMIIHTRVQVLYMYVLLYVYVPYLADYLMCLASQHRTDISAMHITIK